MKRILFGIVLVLVVVAAAGAQTSVGIILGEPTGLSAKQWLGDAASFDLAVAWSFVGTGALYVHLDYQQHFDQLDIDPGLLLLFAGIGPRIYIGEAFVVGARIPLGIVYHFDQAPIELFLELAPGINLFPETEIDFGGGIGIRYRL